jgi:hypothetical protein
MACGGTGTRIGGDSTNLFGGDDTMNTLAYIFLLLCAAFFVRWCFVDLNNGLLGACGIILILWAIPMTWVAIKEDQEILR